MTINKTTPTTPHHHANEKIAVPVYPLHEETADSAYICCEEAEKLGQSFIYVTPLAHNRLAEQIHSLYL
jgi:hypothetical protein